MKVQLDFQLEFEQNTCPHCNMTFALLAIHHNDDPEYGKYISWTHQVHNKGYPFYCPYCGKNFEEDSMTQEWTEDKLRYEVLEILTDCKDDTEEGGMDFLPYINRIHELYKKYTWLKGNEELPETGYPQPTFKYDDRQMGLAIAYEQAQKDMLKPPYNYKSTEEWKK